VRLRFDAPDGTVAFDAHCYRTHSAKAVRKAAAGKVDPKFIGVMSRVLFGLEGQVIRERRA
jgi:hypothetical protein